MTILFVCYANAIRSQMAEGYARARAPEGVRVESAGVMSAQLHPLAVRAMADIGIDITTQWSKPLSSLDPGQFDLVVTLSDHARRLADRSFPRARRLHWPILDPMGVPGTPREQADMFTLTRRDITERIDELFTQEFGSQALRPLPPAPA